MARELKDNLYSLCSRLADRVPNEDDRAMLVGYAVIKSLLDFRVRSGSDEENRFDETKAVYSGLDQVLHCCPPQETREEPASQSYHGYQALLGLKSVVDRRLSQYFAQQSSHEPGHARADKLRQRKEQLIGQSPLLQIILDDLARAPARYEDKIRRKGLELIERLRERGEMEGRRAILISDYQLMAKYTGRSRQR